MSDHERDVNGERSPMNAARFTALVDAYGARPARWPARERAAAEAFAASDPAAKVLLADASQLDLALDRLPTDEVPAGFGTRILSAYDGTIARRAGGPFGRIARAIGAIRDAIWPGAPLWQPASAFAVSLAAGVVLGLLVPSASVHNADPSDNLLVVTPAVFDLDHGN
jgi:hypothetical protein